MKKFQIFNPQTSEVFQTNYFYLKSDQLTKCYLKGRDNKDIRSERFLFTIDSLKGCLTRSKCVGQHLFLPVDSHGRILIE